ncbi:MAG: mannitol dehydrogenase family protein [Lachnospiraceae bacterium]|nr:mannitol dehydrogenase family protein [Lachnospiraceae bacterium]
MELNLKSLKEDRAEWEAAGFSLPSYDIDALRAQTKKAPEWLHFGPGNIFRGFIGSIAEKLIESGELKSGIVAVADYDMEIIDKIYDPFDMLTLSVGLARDGKKSLAVTASIADSIKAAVEQERMREIAASDSLKMVSYTVTEKGYVVRDANGDPIPPVRDEIAAGPEAPKTVMGNTTALLYYRYKAGGAPIAIVSMDNCSANGDRLKASVLYIAEQWKKNGKVDEGFLAYIQDESRVSFPCSMIDKITPRPDTEVAKELEAMGIKDMSPVVTQKGTYIAPFVNAENPQYLVVEDRFPNGRPPLEKAGVYMADRKTVDLSEKMKVMSCLNPLHTALAVCGCLLGYKKISDEMEDADLNALVHALGEEGMQVVADPGIIHPRDFLNEVLTERLPNPGLPDTPQRIATDTSQKMPIRFGGTIRSYDELGKASELKVVPFVIAAWLRYLAGKDDEGKEMELSSDPLLAELKEQLAACRFAEEITDTAAVEKLLSREDIFASDLTKCGDLAERIIASYKKLMSGAGAVRRELHALVSA